MTRSPFQQPLVMHAVFQPIQWRRQVVAARAGLAATSPDIASATLITKVTPSDCIAHQPLGRLGGRPRCSRTGFPLTAVTPTSGHGVGLRFGGKRLVGRISTIDPVPLQAGHCPLSRPGTKAVRSGFKVLESDGGPSWWMRHERGRRIPRQSLGMLVSCAEHERSGAPGRHAPVRANVDEPYGADRRLADTQIPARIAAAASPSSSTIARAIAASLIARSRRRREGRGPRGGSPWVRCARIPEFAGSDARCQNCRCSKLGARDRGRRFCAALPQRRRETCA